VNDHLQPSPFEEILMRLNEEGGFTASVLASDDGLPVAVAPACPPYDADTIAAMVTLVKSFVRETQTRLGLAEVDEMSLVVGDRSRLVCRYFSALNKSFVLTTLTSPGTSYRRLTTKAIRQIIAALEG
jgi:predicted regulator of Ras-like GTPase activity (Roadblock/LC7/MglB family)